MRRDYIVELDDWVVVGEIREDSRSYFRWTSEERSGICKIFPDPSELFSSINIFLDVSHVSPFPRIWNMIMTSYNILQEW